ncbi:glycosyltransferase [Roseobacter sp. HKCCA0434]|uniref:glycosyltransferase n=1 Tax=Roseobacter sp. HKCCA0434 TaxID=3079297 RepID=UPI002905E853|nr:glycosyltransferase [Roseobacter sp. HKCCA0434]
MALATWRGTAHLKVQLDSLAAQTRLPDEVIAVDDASGDATPDLLAAWAAHAPFEMTVLRNPVNLGYARNFERALSRTTGDLVLPCDQDDMWFAQKLARFEDWARARPEMAVFVCDTELTDGALTPSGRTKRGQIAAVGLPEESFVMGCCLGLRRDWLDAMLPFAPGVRAHDNWLVELADRLDLVERHAEVLQYYRQHGANTSDFLANTPEEIGPRARFRMVRRDLARRLRGGGGLERELSGLVLQAERLNARAAAFDALAGSARRARVAAELTARIADLEARAAARAAALPRRLGAVGRLWRTGVYARSGGTGGALRDAMTGRGAGT